MKQISLTLLLPICSLIPISASAKVTHHKESKRQDKPNILFILTDQLTSRALSCVDSKWVHTPNIDRLANQGVRFENAYCSMPLSGPSRFSIFTGRYPAHYDMLDNNTPMPDSLIHKTAGDIMRKNGYECTYAGKWHVPEVTMPNQKYGFDVIHPHNDYGLGEKAASYLHTEHKKPFFLVVSYDNPHNICEYARHQELPFAILNPVSTKDCPSLPTNFEPNPYSPDVIKWEQSLSFQTYPVVNYTPDDWRHYRQAYYQLVEKVDNSIGLIWKAMDEKNLWDNTVVIFTSDHGDGVGAHQWNQKTILYQEVANIPLIVASPYTKRAGTISKALVNNGIDFIPTICAWADAKTPYNLEGKSFRALSEDTYRIDNPSEKAIHPFVVTETYFKHGKTRGWMIRTPKYKYVLYSQGKNREQLYDIIKDPGEMVNLSEMTSTEDIIKTHRAYLREWLVEHHEVFRIKMVPHNY